MEMTNEQAQELQEKIKNMSPEELKEFQKQQCIFCHIVSGKTQAKKVYEDEKVIAILDINPANPGHVLLMPKEHYSIMPLIPDDEIDHLFKVAKQMSKAELIAFKTEGAEEDLGTTIFVANGAVAGQKAQHFMIHIIPRKGGDEVEGLNMDEKTVSKEDINELKKRLRPKIKELLEWESEIEEKGSEGGEGSGREDEDNGGKEKEKKKQERPKARKHVKKEEVVEADFEDVDSEAEEVGKDEEGDEEEEGSEAEESNDEDETPDDDDIGQEGANLDDISRVLF